MAVYKGTTGTVTTGTGAGTAIANIKNWSLTVDVATHDTSAFADTNTTAVHGLRNATAQISGDFSTDATQNTLLDQVSNTGTLAGVVLNLVADTTAGRKSKFLASSALLTNISVQDAIDGVASFSASFQCSGGVKYSTT